MLASLWIESRFETEELRLPLMKKKKAANRDGLCIYALRSFWNWYVNSSSAFSACSSKWPLICNFTSATFESACRLGFRIQAFAACMTLGLISGRCSKTASMARMRPSVSSFVMRFNLQIPEISTAITAKENGPEGATSLRRAIALTSL